MKRLVVFLLLLCLTGCSAAHKTPILEEPVSRPEPGVETPVSQGDPEQLYLYTSGSRYLAIDSAGNVVLETSDGQMSILRRDRKAVGIAVMRSEGCVTDEWGWTQPERTWSDIYDLTGRLRYSVPTSYVNLEGDYLTGYNEETDSTQLYLWSDGSLLYDNICINYSLGDYYYVNQYDWNAPGFFLDCDGRELYRLPEDCTNHGSVLGRYIIVGQNGLFGVVNALGEYVLPCEYKAIRSEDTKYLYVQTDSGWQAIDPDTGATVFSWHNEIYALLQDCVIVATDELSTAYQLISTDGTPLIETPFSWPSRYDLDYDGETELFDVRINDYTNTILFRPDGTVLYQTEDDSYVMPIDNEFALINHYSGRDASSVPQNIWHLLNLNTGETTPLHSESDLYYGQVYSENGIEQGLLSASGANELGWYRTCVLDREGNVLLKDLQDMIYRGDHIFQCSLGFRSGLLRLDGTWLYEESSFSTLDDN